MPERKASRTVSALATIKTFGRCCYCGCKLNEENFSVEHVEPFSESEDSSLENAMVACKTCNSLRSDNTIEAFRKVLSTSVQESGMSYLNKLIDDGVIANSNAIALLKYLPVQQQDVKFYYETLSHSLKRFINSLLENPLNWKDIVVEKASSIKNRSSETEEAPLETFSKTFTDIKSTDGYIFPDVHCTFVHPFENTANVLAACEPHIDINIDGVPHTWTMIFDLSYRLRINGYGCNHLIPEHYYAVDINHNHDLVTIADKDRILKNMLTKPDGIISLKSILLHHFADKVAAVFGV